MIVGGNLVGLAFAALVLTVSAMSFPMLVDRPVDVGTAVATSVRAVAHNPVNMLKWGLIVAVLLLLGSIPVFIGLAVVLPRSEEHTSELQSLMRISYAVFCLKKKINHTKSTLTTLHITILNKIKE